MSTDPQIAAVSTDWGGFHVEHRLTLRAACPKDGTEDVYNCVVEMAGRIAQRGPIYQEDLTRQLADALKAEVVTHGIHSGVYTTCRCSA